MNDAVPLLKFTPSAQAPEALEAITVQREQLIAKLVEDALDTEGGARHRLLIGPRGIGKTHILALVAARVRAAHPSSLTLAWLDEDPWAVGAYEKFLAAIVARVAEEHADPELADTAKQLRAGRNGDALHGEQVLRDALGASRLVLLVENLDEIFRRIGPAGEERFRAFLEDWPNMLIFATAPQLFAGVRLHESPFYGFFAITHLEELNLDSATRLMRLVAEQRSDTSLVEFLGTDLARHRLVAIEALAGGHPRIWLLLSGCVSIRAIDELVPLFVEALDDLTPYYQDRLRELGDQQQELVVLMSEAGGALSNRALAERSGIAQNQVATMLKQLSDRGYVRRAEIPDELATGDARMSYWELREPLMRLCLDVKQARGEPLRMLVEFLRAWYGPRLLDELAALPPSAQLAAAYAGEAFRTLDEEIPIEDLFRGSSREILTRAETGLSLTPEQPALLVTRASALVFEGRLGEARNAFSELIEATEPEPVRALLGALLSDAAVKALASDLREGVEWRALARGNGTNTQAHPDLAAIGLVALGQPEAALNVFPEAFESAPESIALLGSYGIALGSLGRYEEALEAFDRGAVAAPDNAPLQANRGIALRLLGKDDEALEAFERAVDLDPTNGSAQFELGVSLLQRDSYEKALAAFERATGLDRDREEIRLYGLTLALQYVGRLEEAEQAVRGAMALSERERPMFALTLAEIVVSRGDVAGGLAMLREVLSHWVDGTDEEGGDPELVCRILWAAAGDRGARWELIGEVLVACGRVGMLEDLGRALARSIAQMAEADTSQETTDAWVEDWSAAGSEVGDLRIPLTMLEAVRDWKRDRDRSHLLRLPPEQREIVLDLLEPVDESSA